MEKTKTYYICDKCKKEIKEEEIQRAYYVEWYYELCNECFESFKEFNGKAGKIRNKWEKLEKEYQFGYYLPKDEVENER